MTRSAYENKLRARGYQSLGKGMYSNVFAAPNSDKVIKVGEMDEWPRYIFWATQNGYAGNFAPKVYSLKFHDGYYVATMERLVATMNDIRDEGGYDSTQFSLFRKIWYGGDDDDADQFHAFIRELRAAKLGGDIHDSNVMIRKDGQLVITDPISGHYTSSKYRIKSGAIHTP